MQTIAIDDPIAWVSVSVTSLSFATAREHSKGEGLDVASGPLVFRWQLHGGSCCVSYVVVVAAAPVYNVDVQVATLHSMCRVQFTLGSARVRCVVCGRLVSKRILSSFLVRRACDTSCIYREHDIRPFRP